MKMANIAELVNAIARDRIRLEAQCAAALKSIAPSQAMVKLQSELEAMAKSVSAHFAKGLLAEEERWTIVMKQTSSASEAIQRMLAYDTMPALKAFKEATEQMQQCHFPALRPESSPFDTEIKLRDICTKEDACDLVNLVAAEVRDCRSRLREGETLRVVYFDEGEPIRVHRLSPRGRNFIAIDGIDSYDRDRTVVAHMKAIKLTLIRDNGGIREKQIKGFGLE